MHTYLLALTNESYLLLSFGNLQLPAADPIIFPNFAADIKIQILVFNINKEERELFELISKVAAGLQYPVYIVGGYVRDRLLNRDSKDIDIVCIGSGIRLAEEVASILRPRPTVATFARFGTAMIQYKELDIEFVGARKESYTHDSRKPAVEDGTFDDDQNRRDFTINALALSLNMDSYGEIVDNFNGLHHLGIRLIKTPLEPGKTFSDDPLRMMRAIRFACQLDFEIEDKTLQGIIAYRDRIKIISQERITIELDKILASDRPSKGFKLLFDTGLLVLIFPELYDLHGVEVRDGIGHKDNFYHTLEVVDNVAMYSNNIWLRWAALLHDIAKPPTKRFDHQVGWTFHGHEVMGARMVARIFHKMKLPTDTKMKFVQKLVRLHLRPIALTKEEISDSAVRRLLFEAGDDIEDLMILCRADITSKNEAKVSRYLDNYDKLAIKLKEIEDKDHLRNWQPPISGEDIMETFGLTPCREVGVIKSAIREAILDGIITNQRAEAFEFMLQEGLKLGLKPVIT